MPDSPLSKIKHVVVLMLENRSFDNLLGWLYDPQNPKPPFNQNPPPNFDGVSGKNLNNPWQGQQVPVGRGFVPTNPDPDPGEPYQDVYCQVFGIQGPPPDLGKVPPEPPTPANMQGFIYNYAAQKKVQEHSIDPRLIMNCFTPATLPVLSSLAYYYGLCDHWFASIPTQTLCNRSFLHAGTSFGYVDNEGGDGILLLNDTTTIFNVLEQAKQSWKIYCASWLITSLALLTQRQVWDYFFHGDHFGHLDDFLDAARKPGGLPAYSFIEPTYIDSLVWGPENDMHPEANPIELFGPSNVEQGERLLYKVYQAVRNSPDWNSTLLLILFDEHGGCYDHVVPPSKQNSFGCELAISPDGVVVPPNKPGGSDFNFDRLGVRVPAIIVSAYTKQQTILNNCFDHTSALSTIVNCFGLPAGRLGKRQQVAPDVSAALNGPARTDFPPIPQPDAAAPSHLEMLRAGMALVQARSKELSDLQKKILYGAVRLYEADEFRADAVAKIQAVDLRAEVENIHNALEADAFLVKHEAEMRVRRLLGK
jgi:phospholipase C